MNKSEIVKKLVKKCKVNLEGYPRARAYLHGQILSHPQKLQSLAFYIKHSKWGSVTNLLSQIFPESATEDDADADAGTFGVVTSSKKIVACSIAGYEWNKNTCDHVLISCGYSYQRGSFTYIVSQIS